MVVGAGQIAQEYVKVLLAQKKSPFVVTRGPKRAKELKSKFPEVKVITGGLDAYLARVKCPSNAIVATAIDDLGDATAALITSGCKNILVEKPLSTRINTIENISRLAQKYSSSVNIAFNRRAYQSVQKALALIAEDGGVTSIHFDFSEALFTIDPSMYSAETMALWGISNSSHVIDTAFYLSGKPEWIECQQAGKKVEWHEAGSIFTGMGETVMGAPFTYHANWGAPGRWNIEIMTSMRKLLFSPMERLRQQQLGSFLIEDIACDYSFDENYKPGFYAQVEAFLSGNGLFTIQDLGPEIMLMNKIFNY